MVLGLFIRDEYHPGVDSAADRRLHRVVGVAIGAGAQRSAHGDPLRAAPLVGAALGWVLGGWGGADIGDGSIVTAIIAMARSRPA